MKLKNKEGWEKSQAANTDPYGKCCLDFAEDWANLMDPLSEAIRPAIRRQVEAEFLKRLSEPEKIAPVEDLTRKLREFEEAARKNRQVQPHHPWPSPPWPTQPHFPESPYKQPFGPVWCGPDVTTTFTQP